VNADRQTRLDHHTEGRTACLPSDDLVGLLWETTVGYSLVKYSQPGSSRDLLVLTFDIIQVNGPVGRQAGMIIWMLLVCDTFILVRADAVQLASR